MKTKQADDTKDTFAKWSEIERAIEFAAIAHGKQHRKGTVVPYITHPFAVAMLLQRAGCSEEVVVAGLLHDVLEDTSVTLKQLRQKFGEKVSGLVQRCTEPGKSNPWEERKRHSIDSLRTASLEVKFIAAADKLHNLRRIADGLEKLGEPLWQRFSRGKEKQEWYYRKITGSLLNDLPDDIDRSLFEQLQKKVEEVFG